MAVVGYKVISKSAKNDTNAAGGEECEARVWRDVVCAVGLDSSSFAVFFAGIDCFSALEAVWKLIEMSVGNCGQMLGTKKPDICRAW